jgi:ABC-2 type transport system ATP-binding protein
MHEQEVITVEGLRKCYGELTAVDSITFQVRRGEIFGMVGPNGSGKTTTIECIEGLRVPDEGDISVLGLDPQQDGYALRERTGIQLQSSNLPARMRVGEALDLFSSFYQDSTDWRALLKELGLEDKRRSFFSKLSGGQQQRLFVALALINQPEIVFLDELTTGLDPHARHVIWDLVRQIRDRGTTVFLTTHFMDEAEQLCDRVLILDHGRIIALDTPQRLVSGLGSALRIRFQLNGHRRLSVPESSAPASSVAQALARIGALEGVERVKQDADQVVISGQGEGLVGSVIRTLETAQVPFYNLHTEQASLEDVFLQLTGRRIRN